MNGLPSDVQIWLLATWCDHWTRTKIKLVSRALSAVAIMAQKQVSESLGQHFQRLQQRTARLDAADTAQLWTASYDGLDVRETGLPECAWRWRDRVVYLKEVVFGELGMVTYQSITYSLRYDSLFVVQATVAPPGMRELRLSVKQCQGDSTFVSCLTVPIDVPVRVADIVVCDASDEALFVAVTVNRRLSIEQEFCFRYRGGPVVMGTLPQADASLRLLSTRMVDRVFKHHPPYYLQLNQLHVYGLDNPLAHALAQQRRPCDSLVVIQHGVVVDVSLHGFVTTFQPVTLPMEHIPVQPQCVLGPNSIFQGNGLVLLCIETSDSISRLSMAYAALLPIDPSNGRPVVKTALFLRYPRIASPTLRYVWLENYKRRVPVDSVDCVWFAWFDDREKQYAYIYRNDGCLMLRFRL